MSVDAFVYFCKISFTYKIIEGEHVFIYFFLLRLEILIILDKILD